MNDAALRALLEPLLEARDLELDSLTIVPAGRRSVLRIAVDGEGPKGRGPLLDDIAEATRAISEALDASPATGDAPYTLEVSSRGTSTPLTDPKHFRRNRGRLVKVTLVDGRTLVGRIVGVADEGVELEYTPEPTKADKHPQPQRETIAVADVRKAVVQVELNRPHDPELDDDPALVDDEGDEDDEDDSDEDELVEDDDTDEEDR